jgi:hypothetical protein
VLPSDVRERGEFAPAGVREDDVKAVAPVANGGKDLVEVVLLGDIGT